MKLPRARDVSGGVNEGGASGAPSGAIHFKDAADLATFRKSFPEQAGLSDRQFAEWFAISRDVKGQSVTVGEPATAALPARVPDRLEMGAPAAGSEGVGFGNGSRVATAAPNRPPLPPRTPEEVQPEIDAWAAQHGAQAADGSTYPDVMLHGSPRGNISEFDPWGRGGYGLFGTGTYLTDNARIAASYSKKGLARAAREGATDRSVYAVSHSVKNPLDMDAPADLAKWDHAWRTVTGEDGAPKMPEGATNEQAWREAEEYVEGQQIPQYDGSEMMDAFVRSLGHDGITHIGGGRVGDGPRHRVLIALDPEQTTIRDRLSVGDLMTPPARRAPDWIDIGTVPREQAGPSSGDAAPGKQVATSASEALSAPSTLPEGFTLDPPIGRARPMMERPSPEQIADIARGTDPASLLPIPSNEIGSLDEAVKANPGSVQPVAAPDERAALPSYKLSPKGPARKDPLDLIGFLRTRGGIRDDRGELAHMGITNKPRSIDFAKSEGFLGKLVNPEGMGHDDAAFAAWDAGYFPDHAERPTPSEFLDAVRVSHDGGPGRVFHPDDYEAIDNFNAARSKRYAVESAANDGVPLVEDVGTPASMADLDANQPPATAYEDLPALGGKVGNIRVDKLDSTESIGRALQAVDNRFGGFDAARRGKIAQAETKALASELNMTADDLLKRRRGQAFNAEQALAARSILAKSGDELVRLAKAAQGGTDEDLAAFRKGLIRHAAIQEQVSGATAEAGRALGQFRMEAKGSMARGRMLKSIIDSAGGREKLEDVAEKIVELERDPAAANSFSRKVLRPGFWGMAKEYWINALLSGPRTHATNIGSNLITGLWSLPEHAMTAAIGTATRSADRMTFRDVGARAIGMMEGARDGLRLARTAFVTGMPIDGAAQVEAQNYRAIPGKLGELVRIPTRALTAEDEFFKSIAYRGELNALAARQAYDKAVSPADRAKLFAQLRDNPTDAMIDKAVKAAQYQTFQQPLKGPGLHIQQLANWGPGKLFLPFVRTPLNLLKYAVERSPLAPAMAEFRDAYKAGGMRRDQAVARVAMGSGLSALAVSWAVNGKLSGSGPTDPRERQALRNTGWQPFSVKVGGKWYSYQRVDPFARILSTAADFATFGDYMTPDERDNIARALSLAVARNISTMPTLDPAASAFEALSDPDRYLTRYATNLAASVAVPQAVTQINSTIDPFMRETDGLMATIKSRVPVLSQALPARMNLWGEPVTRGQALGPDIVSPVWTSAEKPDKTLREVMRLRVGISMPERKLGGQQLTAEQYARFVYTAGQPAKVYLDRLTASPQWDRMPDGIRRIVIKQVVDEFRSLAKDRLMIADPDLLKADVQQRVKRRMGER